MERQGGKIRVAVVPARGPRHARATGCPVAGTHDQRACELRSWWSWIPARGRCAALTGMTSFGISLLLVAGAPAAAECAPDALRAECVRATFFVLGRNALAHPDILRRELSEGHTVAHHTWSHPLLSRIGASAAEAEIDRGIAAVDGVLYGKRESQPVTPFFRFPGFASSPALLDYLARRRIVVFGADLWASDWNPMSPDAELRLVLRRLEQARGGIVLFHDTKRQTAAMLPALLHALKARGFRVVHVVPVNPAGSR